ncbi:MAG: hypothetical protein KUG79_11330 [Pseudomonadales bacterium]|nr:hypothetical protein [Pseudomonadales bacterium]
MHQVIKYFGMSKLAIFALLISLGSANVLASGSFNPSSSASQQLSYNAGKRVFHKKIACKTCLLPGKKLNKTSATKVVEAISNGKDFMTLLSKKERMAAIYYLKKRHKLS